MRIATYNVEWFNALFDAGNQPLADDGWSGRRDVTRRQQFNALGAVFRRMDADCILVVEAPDTHPPRETVAALKAFAQAFDLRASSVVHGFQSGTQQEIALMFDPAVVAAHHDPQGGDGIGPPRFDGVFLKDVDIDDSPERHVFSKPPLEVVMSLPGGDTTRLIGVHAKSKAPHGARNRNQEVRISIENRRKQLAQCLWLRRRVDVHMEAGESVIVLGDFNDGPGLDEYEKLFGQSGVEIVTGLQRPSGQQLFDPHAAARLDPREAWSPSSARFFNHRRGVYLNALLDYVMISEDLRERYDCAWKIWHPFDDQACFADAPFREHLLTASDHFPVTLDLISTAVE